ncbi:hypothetical protein [Umezawaea sp. NPDC059074]|uniref:hypothetical protein n=1 Tax=Umezawaea sp. NPDC059074 TaxID=3346716 RepID=UPI0036AE88D0
MAKLEARPVSLVVVAMLGVAVLAACSNVAPPAPPPSSPSRDARVHVLEVEVTGTAVLTTLEFTLDGKVAKEKGVVLPWNKKVEVPYGGGRHEWQVRMEYDGGDMAAVATTDGKLVTQTAGSGSPGSANSANLSGSFSD